MIEIILKIYLAAIFAAFMLLAGFIVYRILYDMFRG